jgi:ATP-dependent DNA helicase RecQ
LNTILYVDIETGKNGKINDIGALFNNQELHGKNQEKLKTWIRQSKYICGHNIVSHDIPVLEKELGNHTFQGKKIIDTLLWSPLLFAENPYHKLVKGYKIVNDRDYNNPLSDCKLTKQLLIDELNQFRKLPVDVQQIYSSLLGNFEAYSGFFDVLNIEKKASHLSELIYLINKDRICKNSNISELIKEFPIEFAYAFSLINTQSSKSILFNWVYHKYPKTHYVLQELRGQFCNRLDCTFCNSKLNPRNALLRNFGFENFRSFEGETSGSLQEKTVRAGLSADSFVAVFPTGGGKSLTFQLPALMKGDTLRQLTVIISPLVSLMKDQVENLENRFDITKAAAINGLLSPLERQEAITRVENGEIQLLYLSPESLRSPTILRILKQRSIARFVIDEAHCFSSWGQDFRVDYLYIADFIKILQEEMHIKIPVSCFTATAKPQVIQDIKDYFYKRLDLELKEFITRASRTNLEYEVIEIETPELKKSSLLSLLHRCEQPVIIYASRTKAVEEVSEFINKNGFDSTYFHGKITREEKKENMDAFLKGEKEIIVATSAFGMGVDKDNVKSVIHYNISDSLENYMQESGRAGRNKDITARCYILFNERDLNKHFSLLQQTKINRNEIQQVWQAIKYLSKYRKNKKISNSALEIAQKAGWDTEMRELETKIKTSISALEEQGFVKRKLNSPNVYANSLLVPNLNKAVEKIQKNTGLTSNQKEDCSRVLQFIIKNDTVKIDYLADATGLKIYQVRDVINHLRDLQILGDDRDLTAFINLKRSANNSRKTLKNCLQLESILSKILVKDVKISMRQLNQEVINQGMENSSIAMIKNVLNYWDIRSFLKKNRINRVNDVYHITRLNSELIQEDIVWRHELASDVYNTLESLYQIQKKQFTSIEKSDFPVRFSIKDLKQSDQLFGVIKDFDLKQYEKTLLFLNQIKAIKLEGGFMVVYNKLNIEEIRDDIKFFTVKNYEKMKQHYMHKTEQIHIVGEYAKKRLQDYEAALSFVNDYFSKPYEEFLAQYFPRRKKEISTPLTPKRLQEITKELDLDQLKIMRDGSSKNILVLAGPGSGKTKVLVHKIASLLLLEDIKPEQFLMLTFSKAASLEFRFRTRELVPEYANLINITTFHGFCFQLVGQMGSLEKSQEIISLCTKAIKNEEIDITSITNKSVLLLDEFQDVSSQEWLLIQTIIEKAQGIRVIAVGDDDQNIYEFRGASNKNMLEFKNKYDATKYSLSNNYRSTSHIVKFNNCLLNRIPNRLKETQLQSTKNQEFSEKVELIRYTDGQKNLELPLVNRLIKDNRLGIRAVLTRTNKEAHMIYILLKDAGVKSKLITSFDSFSLDHLFEFRKFTNYLNSKKNDAGVILHQDWQNAKKKFIKSYDSIPNFETYFNIILNFEKNYGDYMLSVDWYEYLRQIKMEDVINPDKDSIMVTTIHKSKGKEFDHVYLLLDNYQYQKTEAKRALYVGMTRAKKTMQLHCNSPFFDSFPNHLYERKEFTRETFKPMYFEIILGHKDINLGDQKYKWTKSTIETLTTGETLIASTKKFGTNEAKALAKTNGKHVLVFSRKFLEKEYDLFTKDGYRISEACVEYLVYWYDSENNEEHKIVLPKIRFQKINQN